MSSEKFEQILEILADFANLLEAGVFSIKRQLAKISGVSSSDTTVPEATFANLLGWEERNGEKLGHYGTTTARANSNSSSWLHALNILKVNNANIQNRYHGENYEFTYWVYGDKIYRQKLKKT